MSESNTAGLDMVALRDRFPFLDWPERYLDSLNDIGQALWQLVRAYEAVSAPEQMAAAWDEGYKQGGPMHDVNYDDPDAHTRNPYRAAL